MYLYSVHRKQGTSEGSVERCTVGEHTVKYAELGINLLIRFSLSLLMIVSSRPFV
jgi:hypothetical protein